MWARRRWAAMRRHLDVDAAGHGWDSVDALEVVVHELGHVLGFDHDDAETQAVMRWRRR